MDLLKKSNDEMKAAISRVMNGVGESAWSRMFIRCRSLGARRLLAGKMWVLENWALSDNIVK